jgi:CheY-like chemotaxis protein
MVTPLSVLVAEDGRMNQHLAVRMLEREGHRVTVADNGESALDEMLQQHFDVVLMDIEMPVMDGISATRRIRDWERETGTHTPIVAVTSNTNRDECLAAGMDAFLSKPLRPDSLHQVLNTVIGGHAA